MLAAVQVSPQDKANLPDWVTKHNLGEVKIDPDNKIQTIHDFAVAKDLINTFNSFKEDIFSRVSLDVPFTNILFLFVLSITGFITVALRVFFLTAFDSGARGMHMLIAPRASNSCLAPRAAHFKVNIVRYAAPGPVAMSTNC